MPLSAGDKLGPYEIVAPLGAGGMGEVYRARDSRLNRDVALKILPVELANDPSRRARFEQEARAVAALNHPNIVAVYDVGDGYIVSELVDGEPLRGAKLSIRKTIDIAVQIASGLAAAHGAGIVHRDLKPDNILLTRDGRPKILDFGLAKMQSPAAAADEATGAVTVTVRTEAGLVMGTPGYMSPEQVRGLVTDHRSDIFSFGVILHELLSGKRAFQGETSMDTMTAILKQEAPELPATVPAALRQIVAHCLEKDAAERFQSARDLRFALSSISQNGSQTASASAPVSRKRWVLPALAAVLSISATFAATRLLWRDTSAPAWYGVMLGGPERTLNPRLSPDGHLLAFQAFEQALNQVAVMTPESGNWSILTHRKDRGIINQVSWSTDGSRVYYDRSTDVPIGVYSVPVLGGGEEQLVLENASAPEVLPDGSLLLNRLNAKRQLQVYRFWPDTGRLLEFPLETPSVAFDQGCYRTAPGGKEAVVYGSPIGRNGQGVGLWAIDLASNAVRRLALPEQATPANLQSWTVSHDGKSVIAAILAGSLTQLVAIPTTGQPAPKTLLSVTSPVWYIEAPAGGGLFLSLVDRPQELVRLSPAGGPPERLAAFPFNTNPDQVLLLPDGRAVLPAITSGHLRIVAAEKGKDPQPLVKTPEETGAPMTLAGPREIAFVIGPAPSQTIARAETATGRITRRIAPGKGVITGLTASPDGATLYFCAGGTVWADPAGGGEARTVSSGESVVMEPSGGSLIVTRGESAHTRMFHVPLDGSAEREIPSDPSSPLFSDHGGYPSTGSIDAKGRLLLSISPLDSAFNPIGIVDTATGRITRGPGDPLGDHHSAIWTPDGKVISLQTGLRAAIWKFQPAGK